MPPKGVSLPQTPSQRANHFKPGQVPNPKGRPTLTEEKKNISALCREFTEEATLTMVQLMRDSTIPPGVRLSAAAMLMERAWGKAPQQVELTGADGGAIKIEQVMEARERVLGTILEVLPEDMDSAGGEPN